MENKPVIAIDGPAGSGKSTIAVLVAKILGFKYIDTGAMYRAVTLKVIKQKINVKNEAELNEMLHNTDIELKYNGGLKVFLDGEDVTEDIRTPEVTKSSSDIADSVTVRSRLVLLQQRMGREGGIVMDGRDIGSVVFPDAKFKFYLDASVDERAKRRCKELAEKGIKQDVESVKKDIIERDNRDLSRPVGALKLVEGAINIDTTNMTIDEVVNSVTKKVSG